MDIMNGYLVTYGSTKRGRGHESVPAITPIDMIVRKLLADDQARAQLLALVALDAKARGLVVAFDGLTRLVTEAAP